MYRIIKSRGTGKTSELMHLAKETGATIVCANPRAFQVKAHEYGFNDDLQFISYDDYWNLNYPVGKVKILVDELDGLLNAYDDNIIGYCLTPDD